MFWSLLQNVGGRGITFLVTLVLARLLTPQDFGLIGMLTIFIQVSQSLINGGFNQALIQKKNTDEEDYSSVFYINLTVSGVLYLILFFSAPLIASFYEQPALVNLTRVLTIVFIINAFSLVQETRLTKNMQFKKLMLINLPSTILGGVVSIVMAVLGYGVWSIVALQVVTRIVYGIQIWLYSKWKPLLVFSKKKAAGLFAFGSNLMITNVIDTIYQNIYLVVIGKFFPLNSVGYYQNADNFVRYPTRTFSLALNKVAFPVFSSIQDDDRKLKEGYKKIIQQLLFWLCPAFVLAGVLAEPLFSFVFTEKWLPAVPYFRWLCIVGVLFPVNMYNLNILNVKGRSDLYLRIGIIKKVIITLGVILSIPFGIWALLAFQALNSVIAYFLNSYYSGRFIKYPVFEQLRDIAPIVVLGIAVGGIVYFLDNNLYSYPDWIRLFIGFGLGGGLYLVAANKWRYSPYMDFLAICQSKLPKRFTK